MSKSITCHCRTCGNPFDVLPHEAKHRLYCSRPCFFDRNGTIEERFWAKVDKGDGTGCWLWTGLRTGLNGSYGMALKRNKVVLAHRFSYELAHGEIPDGKHLDHLCRNRLCVNPAHLEPVEPRENVLRGVGFTAENARKTHCKFGHPFDAENTYITKRGGRACRTCARGKTREWARQKRKERGAKHFEKLTDAQVREIRQRAADGETFRALAAEYGVCRTRIGQLVNRGDRANA
jgi:hypothetical protein